jgi:hypothetical protein
MKSREPSNKASKKKEVDGVDDDDKSKGPSKEGSKGEDSEDQSKGLSNEGSKKKGDNGVDNEQQRTIHEGWGQ